KCRTPGMRLPKPSVARPTEDSTNRAQASPRPGQGSRMRISTQSKARRWVLVATRWKTSALLLMSLAVTINAGTCLFPYSSIVMGLLPFDSYSFADCVDCKLLSRNDSLSRLGIWVRLQRRPPAYTDFKTLYRQDYGGPGESRTPDTQFRKLLL